MKRNKKPLLALILLLVVGTVGVTFAYFGDLIEFPNLFKSKPFSTRSQENFVSPTDWTPGTTTPKEVTVTNTGEVDVLVRVLYKESWKYKNGNYLSLNQNGVKAAIINFDNIDDWYREGDYYYYNKKLSSGETTSSFIKSVTFNENIIGDVTCTTNNGVQNCEASNNSYEGATYTLNIEIETVQLDQYTNIWHTDLNLPDPTLKNTFANDDWDTIDKVFKSGDTERYKVGDTRQIDMGTLGTHTLRIANNSAPSDCVREDFSQTACGAVIEFQDIVVERHNMNSTNTNAGGWRDSSMRTYVNSDIYNMLPSELKNVIINTKVISSHGNNDSINFETTDKLYLLSKQEILGDNSQFDSSANLTRQLDYYASTDITSAIIKKYNNTAKSWWMRSAYSYDNYSFYIVFGSGGNYDEGAATSAGVLPAFRIG